MQTIYKNAEFIIPQSVILLHQLCRILRPEPQQSSKATSCVSATSVHALPCACRRLAFLCPMLQQPASGTMASLSLRGRNLLLLENSALKFKWCGEAKLT